MALASRKSKNICSVVNCSNSYKNNKFIKLYSFPSEKRFPGRKILWIQAVRRQSECGRKPWIPTKSSRVCSLHFVGGRKSDHPHNPAYVPSIFPDIYKKRKSNTKQKTDRYERHLKRKTLVCKENYQDSHLDEESNNHLPASNGSLKDAAVQCFLENSSEDSEHQVALLVCERDGINIGVQASLPANVYYKNAETETDSLQLADNSCETGHRSYRDIACGPSLPTQSISATVNKYENISSESQLKGISGVTFLVFNLFLGFLPKTFLSGRNRILSPENQLLLFLMKLKTGLSCEALGIVWGVHRTTVARNFVDILNCISEATKSWIFWPSESVVKKNMPNSFKNHYENCRCIIDCTEIRTEIPSSVEQQVFLYSQYKRAHTIKFLVATTLDGFISFSSKCYGGRHSDSYITVDSGILNLLEKNDVVLADKGFPQIKTVLGVKDVVVVMPPFSNGGQFTAEEVDETYSVASVRIHVERCIQRIKLWKILDKITIENMPYADRIIHVLCPGQLTEAYY